MVGHRDSPSGVAPEGVHAPLGLLVGYSGYQPGYRNARYSGVPSDMKRYESAANDGIRVRRVLVLAVYGTEGREFESLRARYRKSCKSHDSFLAGAASPLPAATQRLPNRSRPDGLRRPIRRLIRDDAAEPPADPAGARLRQTSSPGGAEGIKRVGTTPSGRRTSPVCAQ